MTDREMKIFLFLMLGIHAAEVAGEILGVDVKPWAQFVLYTGWVYYFLLGYGLKRLCRKEQFPIFAVLAVFGHGCGCGYRPFMVGSPNSP